MILDELTLYIKELLFSRSSMVTSITIERFFRVLGESKELLKLGSDGDFVLSLTLFKMMESLEIQEIDNFIKKLEKELDVPSLLLQTNSVNIASQETNTTSKNHQEIPQRETTAEPTSEARDYNKLFSALITKLLDRNYVLGSCFERRVQLVAYDESVITLAFPSETNDTKDDLILLRQHYKGIILPFVKTIFGDDTKVNISSYVPEEQVSQSEIEMPSSCMMPEPDENNEASKDKDPSTLLKEPMVEKTIELFEPTKVRIIQKV
jgi:DNA polymerase-3 subunit gamma/tau